MTYGNVSLRSTDTITYSDKSQSTMYPKYDDQLSGNGSPRCNEGSNIIAGNVQGNCEMKDSTEFSNDSMFYAKSKVSKDLLISRNHKSVSTEQLPLLSTNQGKMQLKEVNETENGRYPIRKPNVFIVKHKNNDEVSEENIITYHDENQDNYNNDEAHEISGTRNKFNGYNGSNESVNRKRKRSGIINLKSYCAPAVPKPVPITSETKKELRLARISLCIVWLFIFCHVWKLIPTAYETFFTEHSGVGINIEWPYWLTIVKEISHTLITINSSLNFLIYVVL